MIINLGLYYVFGILDNGWPDRPIQYDTIRVYCENTLSYNNGVLSQKEPKSGSVNARQLIYRYSTNTIKLRVKKLDMEYSIIKIITIKP